MDDVLFVVRSVAIGCIASAVLAVLWPGTARMPHEYFLAAVSIGVIWGGHIQVSMRK